MSSRFAGMSADKLDCDPPGTHEAGQASSWEQTPPRTALSAAQHCICKFLIMPSRERELGIKKRSLFLFYDKVLEDMHRVNTGTQAMNELQASFMIGPHSYTCARAWGENGSGKLSAGN